MIIIMKISYKIYNLRTVINESEKYNLGISNLQQFSRNFWSNC